MKATEISIKKFMSQDSTQFIIPVYQRNYDWTKNQCKQLLDDIFRAGESEEISAHFIGSIVYIHDDVHPSADINELIIIDGQQRLTTITLIYLAILNIAVRLKDETL